ncbi:low-affinity phosphate transporter [Savitreella phatthalungensis]
MKFSHSLQFNSVPEWQDNYIAYSNLKKLIYILEKAHLASTGADDEESGLLAEADPDTRFIQALDKELFKIEAFARIKEAAIQTKYDDLAKQVGEFQREDDFGEVRDPVATAPRVRARRSSSFAVRRKSSYAGQQMNAGSSGRRRESDEENRLTQTSSNQSREAPAVDDNSDDDNDDPYDTFLYYESQIALKKRVAALYVEFSEFRSYVNLNSTGFTKATKKYDKTVGRSVRSAYMRKVDETFPFTRDVRDRLDSNIDSVVAWYAGMTRDTLEQARKELKAHLREHVVWERNTVWREMINIERRTEAASVNQFRSLLAAKDEAPKIVRTPLGRYQIPPVFLNSTLWTLFGCLAVFFGLIYLPTLQSIEQSNCLAILVFASLLWATEVIPLFTTALLIPLLVVCLRVVRSDDKQHTRLSAPAATKYIFAAMWTPTIMLLLGGFSLAAALSKHHIAKMLATSILSKVGQKPRNVLLASMCVATFLSMWISNVAAPVLVYSILQPILRTLPDGSSFAKCLIIGVALASNIGGMASPIASPQNIVALQNMSPPPSWGQWFFVSVPVCMVSIIAIWLLLLFIFRNGDDNSKGQSNLQPIRASKDKFDRIQYFIAFVTLATIVLWCVERQFETVLGDMGVVALIPLVVFFGTGVLTKEDFNNFLWTVVILAMGGISLGKAVSSSGLLATIASEISSAVQGLPLYAVFCVFAALVLVVATFISHTVAALIVLPVVAQVGAAMEDPHPRLLVMGAALMCSAAMGLPTSGFPNMVALASENEVGTRYLTVFDFLRSGVPASVVTFGVVVSLGFLVIRVAGL